MKIEYDKETNEWTIICGSCREFNQLVDCALFAHDNGSDKYAQEKNAMFASVYRELQHAQRSTE